MSTGFTYITTELEPGALVLEIQALSLNDFDLAHAVADEIDQAMRQFLAGRVILDLRNVQLLTSVGLIVFARALKTANQHGVRVVLCNAAPVVAEVLTLSRFALKDRPEAGHLAMASDLNAALAACAEPV